MNSSRMLLLTALQLLMTLATSAVTIKNRLFYLDGETGNITLVSLASSAENCRLPDYPESILYPAAVNFNETDGTVVACGGRNQELSSMCWKFDGSSWTPLPDATLHHCYEDSTNMMADQGWWVAGRPQTSSGTCANDEWTSELFTGEEWISGPQHPYGYSRGSCLVHLNSTHSLLAGGAGGLHSETQSWIYHWAGQQWTRSGDLQRTRYIPGCAVVEDLGVLVAGGVYGDDDNVFSVELFDHKSGTFSAQPDLPAEVMPYFPTLLVSGNSVVALFFGTDKVFQRGEDGSWSVLEGALLPETYGRFWDRAVLVPDEFTFGCL